VSRIHLLIECAMFICIAGCFGNREVEIKRFPIDSLNGIITQSGVQIDKKISSDGNGSLRITTTEPTVIHLFEVKDIDVENARLIYRAQVRTENLKGQIYLEIRCNFPIEGELFSRGRITPITGTMDWTREEVPFFVAKESNPDNIKLNLIIDGKGTVWIDDVRLLKGPLRSK
jgi:hypothetical protein